MKRQRKEQTSVQDASSYCNPVHGMRKKLKPLLPTFPGGLMQVSDPKSPRMEMHVGKAEMGKRPNQSKKSEWQACAPTSADEVNARNARDRASASTST